MTDSQRSKFWNSIRTVGRLQAPMTDPEITAFVLSVVNTAWFRKRAKVQPSMGTNWKVTEVAVQSNPAYTHCQTTWEPTKTRAGAKVQNYRLNIGIGAGERSLVHVFHVLTHIIKPGDHDPEFCRTMLETITRFESVEAKKTLQTSFRANKVKHRVYSDEARAAARHRLIARNSIPDLVALRDELAGS